MEVRLMKPFGFISTGVLLLFLGTIAPTYAQKEQQQEAKPPKQVQQGKSEKQQHDRNKPQQDKNKPQDQNKQQQQRARQQDQNKGQQQRAQQQDQNRQQQQRQQENNRSSQQGQRVQHGQQREVWQQHRARNWQSEHRDWQQRGGYNGYRIPEDHYRGNFGPNHWFRIYRYPVEVFGGYPRFQYGGFWFGLMDPWPEY